MGKSLENQGKSLENPKIFPKNLGKITENPEETSGKGPQINMYQKISLKSNGCGKHQSRPVQPKQTSTLPTNKCESEKINQII